MLEDAVLHVFQLHRNRNTISNAPVHIESDQKFSIMSNEFEEFNNKTPVHVCSSIRNEAKVDGF